MPPVRQIAVRDGTSYGCLSPRIAWAYELLELLVPINPGRRNGALWYASVIAPHLKRPEEGFGIDATVVSVGGQAPDLEGQAATVRL